MKEKKDKILSCLYLIIISIIYTVLIKYVDVAAIGPKMSEVGFSKLNLYINNFLGTHSILEKISDVLIIIPTLTACGYFFLGLKQLIERKSLFKVDIEIYALAAFYIMVGLLYVFFEVVIINYRPVLEDGMLSASYPSSHSVLVICLCGASLLMNKYFYKRYKITKLENKISTIAMLFIVSLRLISGVHWFTDIIGGIIISITYLKILDTALFIIKKNKTKKIKN